MAAPRRLPLRVSGPGRGSRAFLAGALSRRGGAPSRRTPVAHAASYQVALQLDGPESAVRAALASATLPEAGVLPGGTKPVQKGHLEGSFTVRDASADGAALAPVTCLWRPRPEPPPKREGAPPAAAAERRAAAAGVGAESRGGGAAESTAAGRRDAQPRSAWVWVHVAALAEVAAALGAACAQRGVTLVRLFLSSPKPIPHRVYMCEHGDFSRPYGSPQRTVTLCPCRQSAATSAGWRWWAQGRKQRCGGRSAPPLGRAQLSGTGSVPTVRLTQHSPVARLCLH